MGTSSIIFIYKNRVFDPEQLVYVYKNNKGLREKLYTVKQDGKVVGHTNQLTLKNCKFIVKKNSRPYICGSIARQTGAVTSDGDIKNYPEKIDLLKSNFMCGKIIAREALSVMLNGDGITAAYIN